METIDRIEDTNSDNKKHSPWKTIWAYLCFLLSAGGLIFALLLLKSYLDF